MSQQSVLNLIKRSKKPLTALEISRKLRLSSGSVNANLKKLLKQMEIKHSRKLGVGCLKYLYFK